jgi:hypothetical protein
MGEAGMDWFDLLPSLLLFPTVGALVIWTARKRDGR